MNNTFVTSDDDLKECVVVAEDATHDLAIIQLKDKKTPESCAIFDVSKPIEGTEHEAYDEFGNFIDVDNLSLGTKLYMLGFNLGPKLALTQDGIKAQVTDGAITQNTDDVKILYSISALHGSSGSPVVDEYGHFVGINFAGLDITQNFNYGIRCRYLRMLLGL